MKLEVGMYVRTNKVGIKKIYKIDNNKTKYKYLYKLKNQDGDGCIDLSVLCEDDIVKFSYNIIDLISVGDYVNRHLVKAVYLSGVTKYIKLDNAYENGDGVRTYAEDIKSIVTKEMYQSMEYRIGE